MADFGSNSTGRVTRSSLKPLKEDIEPSDRSSRTPPPTNKRRRLTESPATRYSPEPPVTKRTRKSMPAQSLEPIQEKPNEPSSKITPEPAKKVHIAHKSTLRISQQNPLGPSTSYPPKPVLKTLTKVSSLAPKSDVNTPSVEPTNTLILDPRAKKTTEVVQKENNNQGINNADIPDTGYVESNGVEKVKVIQKSINNDDFIKLKDYKEKEIDVDELITSIQEQPLDKSKVATNYDDFVLAVITGNASIIHTTLHLKRDAFNLNDRDREGRTLLHHIAMRGCDAEHKYDAVARILVSKGAELSFTDNLLGRTPLHTAVNSRKPCMVETLLDVGSPVNTLDKTKNSPLMTAVALRDITMVKILLRGGGNVHDSKLNFKF